MLSGVWDVSSFECWDAFRDSHALLRTHDHNLIPNEGLNLVLDILRPAGQAKASGFYFAPFEGNYTPAATITAAAIVAAATECTAYGEATRAAWIPSEPAGQTMNNSSGLGVVTFNASKNIYGAFISTVATKSATTGALLSAARFSLTHAVQAGYVLSAQYDLAAASA